MEDVVHEYEIQNRKMEEVLELQTTPSNVSVFLERVAQGSHVEDYQATSPMVSPVLVLTELHYKQ
jgi:Ni,Fe-hydrogenase III large subunit